MAIFVGLPVSNEASSFYSNASPKNYFLPNELEFKDCWDPVPLHLFGIMFDSEQLRNTQNYVELH